MIRSDARLREVKTFHFRVVRLLDPLFVRRLDLHLLVEEDGIGQRKFRSFVETGKAGEHLAAISIDGFGLSGRVAKGLADLIRRFPGGTVEDQAEEELEADRRDKPVSLFVLVNAGQESESEIIAGIHIDFLGVVQFNPLGTVAVLRTTRPEERETHHKGNKDKLFHTDCSFSESLGEYRAGLAGCQSLFSSRISTWPRCEVPRSHSLYQSAMRQKKYSFMSPKP